MKYFLLCMLICSGSGKLFAQPSQQRAQLEKVKKTNWLNTDSVTTSGQTTELYYNVAGKQLVVNQVFYERKADSLRLDFIVETNLPLNAILGLKLKDVTNPADEGDPVYECALRLKPGTVFPEKYYTRKEILRYSKKELKLYFSPDKTRALAFIRDVKKGAGIK